MRKYITRENLKEVDDETLLRARSEDYRKSNWNQNIHVTKCMRVINHLRGKQRSGERALLESRGRLVLVQIHKKELLVR